MPRWTSQTPDADRRFVQGLNEENEESLGALYDTYGEQLYDYCLSMAAEPKAAADLVHDTFIDAQRRAPRMRDRTQLRAWLYGAARRRCMQRGRTRGLSWNWASGSAWMQEVFGTDAGVTPGELRELVESALGRLDFADQEVLLLTLRHGLRAAETSVVLGQPARRVTALVAQARARAEAAVTAELRSMSRRCQAGRAPVPALHPAEAPVELADRTAELESSVGARAGGTSSPSDVRVAPVPGGRRLTRNGASAGGDAPPEGTKGAEDAEGAEDAKDAAHAGGRTSGGLVVGAGSAVDGPETRRRAAGRHGRTARGRRRRAAGAPCPSSDPALDRHLDDCAECGRRDRVTVAALLVLAPAPVLPAALRHRVVHTATDPELAGHRTDIAARGGTLTPEGLPRQPDVPSQYTRRWLFVGGGAAGALVTTLVAILLMNPVSSDIRFPFDPRPQPSIGDVRQGASDGRLGDRPMAQGPDGSPQVPPSPGGQTPQVPHPEDTPPDRDGRTPRAPQPPPDPEDPQKPEDPQSPQQPPLPPQAGELAVGPAEVTVGRNGAVITLTAQDGPVAWSAVTTSDKLSLSASDGTLEAGASTDLHVLLKDRSLINLPGEAMITVTDRQGERHEIDVRWHLSLL
ncbi:RNA polymerase sigma factor, sigma-70 family [Thermomonospora echinospora]|uniref:RNA polymerase sigma factor, sigma-70 family n=1 Tax=Thermomonospora echinospora TaxID=1992 RepID=A0A1H6CWE1_9ACTN|nr:sigma factor [Thermomonospora echinospora]SEG77033.1 RNA polymerase sigma factor, sigma-70 family [Thermomonospora echinospora]